MLPVRDAGDGFFGLAIQFHRENIIAIAQVQETISQRLGPTADTTR